MIRRYHLFGQVVGSPTEVAIFKAAAAMPGAYLDEPKHGEPRERPVMVLNGI